MIFRKGGEDRMKPRLDIAIHFRLLFGKNK